MEYIVIMRPGLSTLMYAEDPGLTRYERSSDIVRVPSHG